MVSKRHSKHTSSNKDVTDDLVGGLVDELIELWKEVADLRTAKDSSVDKNAQDICNT